MLIQLIYLISAQTRALFTSDMSFLKVCMWERDSMVTEVFRNDLADVRLSENCTSCNELHCGWTFWWSSWLRPPARPPLDLLTREPTHTEDRECILSSNLANNTSSCMMVHALCASIARPGMKWVDLGEIGWTSVLRLCSNFIKNIVRCIPFLCFYETIALFQDLVSRSRW